MELTRIEYLLNYFPKKKINCRSCNVSYYLERGKAKFAKKHYNGPYCPKCGEPIKK